jgi:hypothetical protein
MSSRLRNAAAAANGEWETPNKTFTLADLEQLVGELDEGFSRTERRTHSTSSTMTSKSRRSLASSQQSHGGSLHSYGSTSTSQRLQRPSDDMRIGMRSKVTTQASRNQRSAAAKIRQTQKAPRPPPLHRAPPPPPPPPPPPGAPGPLPRRAATQTVSSAPKPKGTRCHA